jgi:hypothetical protein
MGPDIHYIQQGLSTPLGLPAGENGKGGATSSYA